jgi:glucose-6-phosphate 1-dehydrogenase
MDYRDKPLLLVVFGITGDLAHRKILPALYRLLERGDLPHTFAVVGVTRQEYSVDRLYDDFAARLTAEADPRILENLRAATTIATLDMTSATSYTSLKDTLEAASAALGQDVTRIYYLSIPAQAFTGVIDHLGSTGHNQPFKNESSPPRLLIEKPFGYDLSSAKLLVNAAAAHFTEEQLYRIDHYLAKETAQNILTFRFNNPLFQTIWNARHIDRIAITAHESIGIEGRANFYEQTGALRDIIQSHLLQLLALITMEQPGKLDSEGIRRAKRRLLESIIPIGSAEVAEKALRGQYRAYRQEVQNLQSRTETFARLSLDIDNEQWRGVAIELETGKALPDKESKITVHFRNSAEQPGSNTLIFRLQPREGITLTLEAKTPGLSNDTETVEMAFDYASSFTGGAAEAYERVIVDAIRGDQSLFLSSEEVIVCWQIVENVLEAWQASDDTLAFYESGTHPFAGDSHALS